MKDLLRADGRNVKIRTAQCKISGSLLLLWKPP